MGLVASLTGGATLGISPAIASSVFESFIYNPFGATQSWSAPAAGVIELQTVGGGGAGRDGGGQGGSAALVTSWWTVAKGEVLNIRVGGGAGDIAYGAGGSATSVKSGSTLISIAAGGGGGGSEPGSHGGNGGYSNTADGGTGGGGGGSVGKKATGGKGGDAGSGGNGGRGYNSEGVIQSVSPGGNTEGRPLLNGGLGGNFIGGGGGGTNGILGGNGGGLAGEVYNGGLSNSFTSTTQAGFGGGGATLGGGSGAATNSGGGGGGFAGGGGGSRSVEGFINYGGAGGGAGSSFASVAKKPAGKPAPTYRTASLATTNGYGVGGGNESPGTGGNAGAVTIEFIADPPPAPVTPTPGKPGSFVVTKKTTAKNRHFKWRASRHATRSTIYTLEIRAKGKKKVLIRKHVRAGKKRLVTIKRSTLIKKSRKYQRRARSVKLRATIYAKTGSKRSTTAAKNFNVRR